MGVLFLWLIVKSVISSQQLSLNFPLQVKKNKKSHFSLAALFISDILIYFQVIIHSLTYEQLLDSVESFFNVKCPPLLDEAARTFML